MHSNQNLTKHTTKCKLSDPQLLLWLRTLMFLFLCVCIKLQDSYHVVKLICKWHNTGLLEGRWLRTFLPSIEAKQNHNMLDSKLYIG